MLGNYIIDIGMYITGRQNKFLIKKCQY